MQVGLQITKAFVRYQAFMIHIQFQFSFFPSRFWHGVEVYTDDGVSILFCYIFMFIFSLFNDDVSASDYIASNGRTFSEQWIGKSVEGIPVIS
jgi:hypothetical protein